MDILILEDDPNIVRICTRALAGLGLSVIAVGTVAEAVTLVRSRDFALFISDLRLPDGRGLPVVAQFRELRPQASAIVMTGSPNVESEEEAKRLGILAYLRKPFSVDAFQTAVRGALKTRPSP